METASSVTFCSSANLGPGYDVLALALDAFADKVTVKSGGRTENPQVVIRGNGVPDEPRRNTAGLSVLRMIEEMDIDRSITIDIQKGVPAGLGLGSSGASASAAVLAVNTLFNLGLSRDEMVEYAMHGETASSGTPHPDNVAASIFGNLSVVTSISPLRVRSFRIAENLTFLLMMPDLHIENKTKRCRELVPRQVSITDVVANSRRLSSLIPGLLSGDPELLASGLGDAIVEESRKPLYPYFEDVRRVAVENGAIGACLSGAGPSVLAFLEKGVPSEGIKKACKSVFERYGLSVSFAIANPAEGAVIEQSSYY